VAGNDRGGTRGSPQKERRCAGGDLNRTVPEQKSEALLPGPTCSASDALLLLLFIVVAAAAAVIVISAVIVVALFLLLLLLLLLLLQWLLFLGGSRRPAGGADNLTAICEPIV
jgi:hypothetical protein